MECRPHIKHTFWYPNQDFRNWLMSHIINIPLCSVLLSLNVKRSLVLVTGTAVVSALFASPCSLQVPESQFMSHVIRTTCTPNSNCSGLSILDLQARNTWLLVTLTNQPLISESLNSFYFVGLTKFSGNNSVASCYRPVTTHFTSKIYTALWPSPLTCAFWSVDPQPNGITALWLVLIAPLHEGMARLSWPGWLVTYRDKCPAPW